MCVPSLIIIIIIIITIIIIIIIIVIMVHLYSAHIHYLLKALYKKFTQKIT